MPLVDRCCCGCPLRAGSLAIVIIGLISVISYIIHLYNAEGTVDINGNVGESPSFLLIIFLLCHPVLGFIGIYKKLHVCVLIYVIFMWIGIALYTLEILLIYAFATAIFVHLPPDVEVSLALMIVAWVWSVYNSIVVFSYWQELKHGSASTAGGTVV